MIITSINAIATVAIAISAIASAIITAYLARENRKLRQAGIEPHIVAFILPEKPFWGGLNLSIKNVGEGSAKNLKVSVNINQDDRDRCDIRLPEWDNHELLGLLPQGESIATLLGTQAMFGDNGLPPFFIKFSYDGIDGRSFETSSKVDVRGLKGVGAGIPEGNHLIHKHLKKIATLLENLSIG